MGFPKDEKLRVLRRRQNFKYKKSTTRKNI